MRKPISPIIFACTLVIFPVMAFSAQEIIEKIELTGNTYFTKDAFFHLLTLKEGDPYDEDRIKKEYKKLWDSGYFSDLSVESEDGEKGKIIRFRIKERAKITGIEYDEVKTITRTEIEDRLKERGISFKTNVPLDMKTIWKVEETIKELLGAKGYLDAVVKAEINPITATTRTVHFKIKRGSKTRIKKIDFVGNKVFRGRKLKNTMKYTREHWFLSFLTKKDLYHPSKYEMDIGTVRDIYLNDGYMDIKLGTPIVEVREEKKKEKPLKPEKEEKRTKKITELESKMKAMEEKKETDRRAEKKRKKKIERLRTDLKKKTDKLQRRREEVGEVKKWVYLTIPVTEGSRYTLGDVSITGNTVFTEEHIRKRVPLKKGDILNEGLLKVAVEVITADYGEKGYPYASVNQQKTRREGNIADVLIQIDEDQQYYIEKVEYFGNNVTNDSVLRREMRLNEGDLFNRKKMNLSLVKLNQLGYFALTEEPVIEPIPGENRVRIKIKGEERGRNEIQVGGGYSGLEGAFFAGSYSTKNFLGRGEVFSISLQIGGRSNRYSLSFIEPWLFGKPYTLGFNIYHTQIDFGRNLKRTGQGGGIILGRQFGYFTKIRLDYNFEDVESDDIYGNIQETRISSLTPSVYYDTVNNPFKPSRGFLVGLTGELAGGFLGGDVNFYKPRLESTYYLRFIKKTFFGIHAEGAYIGPFGEMDLAGFVDGVPRFERFFLGGDYLGPRIYETRSISPIRKMTFPYKDPITGEESSYEMEVYVGGNKYLLVQLEYVIPISEPVSLVFFYDAGNSFDNGQRISFSDMRMSAGIELRFYIPMFQVPLRLIYGIPINEQPYDEINRFQFSIGTSF
ncbi:MAG: outer membrane protein assembly factor BamA [Acidobacteriota bacterium]